MRIVCETHVPFWRGQVWPLKPTLVDLGMLLNSFLAFWEVLGKVLEALVCILDAFGRLLDALWLSWMLLKRFGFNSATPGAL